MRKCVVGWLVMRGGFGGNGLVRREGERQIKEEVRVGGLGFFLR